MLRLLAHAKINWSLDIVGIRPDGYHLMDMLMESVGLADELTLAPAPVLAAYIEGNASLSAQDNLVMKAARALQNVCKCTAGAEIHLLKRTPVGAGMGGGSADAAATLAGLNRLWSLNLSTEELQQISLPLGADIPFMLAGGLARVGGIGEVIHTLPVPKAVSLVIVQPCQALSTREVFAAYDTDTHMHHPQTDIAQEALRSRDFAMLSRAAGNVLQYASERKRPQIGEAIAVLDACGAAFATMTGSGSAVFGAFAGSAEAQAAYRLLHKRWKRCWLTQTVADGIEML